jgi:hypothetical protein
LDHRHALEAQAAERYLLGELPAAEAEEFELHYFECPQCTLAVESGEMFISAVRESAPLAEKAAAPARNPRDSFWVSLAAFWRQPTFGLAAAAVLAVLALYQGVVVIPGLRENRSLPAFQLIGASRSEDQKVRVPGGTPFVSLAADIPPEYHFREYVCVISRGGSNVFTVVSPQPEEGRPVTILVATDQLRPGRQELTIFGQGADGKPSDKISTYPFDFEAN